MLAAKIIAGTLTVLGMTLMVMILIAIGSSPHKPDDKLDAKVAVLLGCWQARGI